jgi:hypothetical protein
MKKGAPQSVTPASAGPMSRWVRRTAGPRSEIPLSAGNRWWNWCCDYRTSTKSPAAETAGVVDVPAKL